MTLVKNLLPEVIIISTWVLKVVAFVDLVGWLSPSCLLSTTRLLDLNEVREV